MLKKRIAEAPSMIDVIKKNVNPDGKYIYFCPSNSIDGTNDIETIKKEAIGWFKQYIPEENIMFYTSLSSMTDHGKSNREAFYNDLDLEGNDCSNKLRIMFTINQYNEGIHAPNVDGVIMGRSTCSDIIWGEQIGRALSVRGDTKQKFDYYMNYSVDELIKLCKERNIDVSYDTSKVEIIEKLIAPTIIDLVDNYEFIYELENNLRDRIKERQENGFGFNGVLSISDASFDIDVVNHDLFEMLFQVKERLLNSWDVMYEYAKEYYEEYGNLEVPIHYVNEYGIKLGQWISIQRSRTDSNSERGQKLLEIGMIFENLDEYKWNKMFMLAKVFYEKYGNLEVPARYVTEDGLKLGNWINSQRYMLDPQSEKGQMLLEIGMRFERKNVFKTWDEMYEYAKAYFKEHDNLLVPKDYINSDGARLGAWISKQRILYKIGELDFVKQTKLEKIGMQFSSLRLSWDEWYAKATLYVKEHGDLLVPLRYRTVDGYKLGSWVQRQRVAYKNMGLPMEKWEQNIQPLTNEHFIMLKDIGMVWDVYDLNYENVYKDAVAFFEKYGHLKVTANDNSKLHSWLLNRRRDYRKGLLSEKRISNLDAIGMIWDIKKNIEDVNSLCKEYDIDINKNKSVIKSISYKELKAKLLFLNDSGIPIVNEKGILHEIFSMSSMNMKLKYDVSLEDLINKYIVSFGKGSNS